MTAYARLYWLILAAGGAGLSAAYLQPGVEIRLALLVAALS